MNNAEKVDKVKRKRFRLLCKGNEFRVRFWWWSFKIIGNAPRVENPLPKWKGDRQSTVAYRQHVADLAKIYAPRVKCPVGHRSRFEYCTACADNMAAEAQKTTDAWLIKKGITEEQWKNKIAGI
jgi:hypothetical protein